MAQEGEGRGGLRSQVGEGQTEMVHFPVGEKKNFLWPIHSIHSGGEGEGGGSYSGI